MFEKLLEVLLGNSLTSRYYAIIVFTVVTIFFFLFIILSNEHVFEMIKMFYTQFISVEIFKKVLFLTVFLFLPLCMILAGLLETDMAEKHKSEALSPTTLMFFLNLLVGICVIGLIISSLYSIIAFSIIYLFFIPIDYLFRHKVTKSLEKKLKEARKTKPPPAKAGGFV